MKSTLACLKCSPICPKPKGRKLQSVLDARPGPQAEKSKKICLKSIINLSQLKRQNLLEKAGELAQLQSLGNSGEYLRKKHVLSLQSAPVDGLNFTDVIQDISPMAGVFYPDQRQLLCGIRKFP